MSGVFVPVVDAVRAVLPLPAGFTADDGATEPTLPKPRRLYVWPRRLAPQRVEEANGRFDEAGVRLRVLYTVGARGEPRVQRNDRAVTLALDAIVPGVVAAVAANRRAWQNTDLVVEKPDVIHAVYERIVIEGPRFVGLRLTPAAYRHGLALGLPDAVMARPTGVGRGITTYTIPIEGRDEWLAAAGIGA